MAEDRHAQEAEEARRELDRLGREGDALAASSMARVARKAGAHLSAADAADKDPAELWGRRIGRSLSVVFLVLLIGWLAARFLA